MRFLVLALALALAFAMVPAFARSYDTSHLPYSDVPIADGAAVAISTLTEIGVLRGNPDGTFRPSRLLNRAEFVTIAMRLKDLSLGNPVYHPGDWRVDVPRMPCFPDVPRGAWYELRVCEAKEWGIVQGNVVEGVPPDQWLFAPERPVQYEEAVKILIELYDLSLPPIFSGEWYEPYLTAAALRGVTMPFGPGYKLRRGEMAQLAARFYALHAGALEEFLIAEGKEIEERKDERTNGQSSMQSSQSSHSSHSSHSSLSSVVRDPLSDTADEPAFLMLGTASAVLAGINVFSDSEPLDVTVITMTMASDVSEFIDHLLVYDHDTVFIGKATLDTSVAGGKTYRLRLKNADLRIPYRESYSFYVRARLRHFDAGGKSGQTVQVSTATVEGDGVWSNRAYTKSSTETFSQHQTARSRVLNIANAEASRGVLVSGPDQPIASFRFAGELGDSRADLRVTDLTFQIEQLGSIEIANVELGADGTNERMSCTVGSSTVTCSSIDAQFGSFEDRPRILTLYGDITVPSGSKNTALRLTLNQPGDIATAGAVTWTDGTSTFTWVPFDAPVARGVYLE